MYKCPAGHLAVRKAMGDRSKEGKNRNLTYHFDINKCKSCSMHEGCYKDGAKHKTYSITILSETHRKQKEFQKTEYFKLRAKQRYII